MKIILTVTNDLNFDQRMQRIAHTLVEAGHSVTLVGRVLPNSLALQPKPYQQHRLRCWWNKGFLFYAEFNIRLFFWLLHQPMDALGTVDLDTLPGGCKAAFFRRKKRVFDAHEYFTEVPELVGRPMVKAIWGFFARIFLPFYHRAYTVGPALANMFRKQYGLPFKVVRNVPFRKVPVADTSAEHPKVILYQGALNEGRGLEAMLEAMQQMQGVQLWLAGEGDCSQALRNRAQQLALGDRVRFLGFVRPDDLPALTDKAWVGINLLENRGLSYYYSLANKFFDYVQAGKPIITMDFPEYHALNNTYEVAVLLPDLQVDAIVQAIQGFQADPLQYARLAENCLEAASVWNWENEENTLLEAWNFER
ncbi:MAG: glycosyltransferase [Lewinellaceae bacterium]|nr:glycosyltransferase [Lewinellaceae bacterium]